MTVSLINISYPLNIYTMTKFKLKLKRTMAEALCDTISQILESSSRDIDGLDDFDKMHLAALSEIKLKTETKLLTATDKLSFSLSPPQAFAIRILHTHYVLDRTSYLGNKLMMLANEIHQQYS